MALSSKALHYSLCPRRLAYPGPYGVQIKPVTDAYSAEAATVSTLFSRLFPLLEIHRTDLQRYMQNIELATSNVINHTWLITLNDEPLGLRLFSYLPQLNSGHGAFVGLLPKAQGMGIGSWLVQQTRLQLVWDAQHHGYAPPDGYCVEIERLEEAASAHDLMLRRRRLQFHLQNGAIILPVQFQEPLVPYWPDQLVQQQLLTQAIAAHPMELLWYPQQAATMLSAQRIQQLVTGIYRDIYCLPEQTEVVQAVLRSIYHLL